MTDWLRGAVDIHVHAAPSLFPRRGDDLEMAREAREAGMRGLVLKAHEGDTSGRAELCHRALDGIEVLGGVVLNRFVGGMNPEAVEVAVALGARVVWMPTLHAENHLDHYGHGGFDEQPGALPDGGREPVRVLDGEGRLLPRAEQVLEVLAAHPEVVLSNGHLDMGATEVLFTRAQEKGLERLVITHPELPLMGYELEFQVRWAERGVWIERSWLPHLEGWGEFPVERTAEEVRRIGPERCVLSTDLGQASQPPPVVGLEAFCRALSAAGLAEADVRDMVSRNPARLLGLDL